MSARSGVPDAAAPSTDEQNVDPRRWMSLGVVLIAGFMVLLDISIVNVAIPSIQRDLHASFGQIQLVLALYQLAYAVVLITGGRLGDIYGRRRLFMVGMIGFVLASALCGFAQSPEILIVSRVLQGLMAALMFPQILSVIQVSFPPRERGVAFAIFGGTIGLATITGPLLGGLLIQINVFGLDWRPIFLVNLPIGVGALLAAVFLLRESRAPKALHLDIVGVTIVSVGLFLLIWPLVEGRDAGWPPWAFVCLAASVPVLILFALFEKRQNALRRSPLVEMSLFHERSFVVGLILSFLFFGGLPSFFLTFSLFLQIGLGFSALHAGLITFPFSAGSFMASAASARLAATIGKRVLYVGSAALVAGISLVILTLHLTGTGLQGVETAPALFLCGLGLGAIIAPLVNIILAGINSGDAGSASGVLTTVQQVGGAVGVAIIGVIFFGMLGNRADGISRSVAPALRTQLLAQRIPQREATGIVLGFERCFHDRSNANDPGAVPPTCRSARISPAIGRAVQQQAAIARARDFLESFNLSLLYNITVFCATFVLVIFLPGVASRRLIQGSEAGDGEGI